ncbi:MAG: hypothetical protein KY445_06705 [Armatimonadetes bacterium]|nr:hypothetical protein [Armatimonadota bacterium]
MGEEDKLAFYIDGTFAATFVGEAFPSEDGRYRYMPYRGPGHYDLVTTMTAFGFARCFYEDGADVVHFTARPDTEYGFLNLSEFERTPKHLDGYAL